jgi:hypothetical protein
MQIERTENELIIRETPGCLWIFALLFLIVGGIFVYGAFGNFSDHSSVPFWVITVAFVMGSIGCAVGLRLIHRSPITKVVIDRDSETVAHTTYGITGRTHAVYHFDEIEEFCLIEDNDSEGESIWSLGMEISGGETIKISSLESHVENFKRDFVFRINEFMGKEMPSAQAVFELENESEDEMS